MKRVVHAAVAAALASTVLGAAAAPASAERWWGRDKSGDVTQYRFLTDPPPCGTFREAPKPDDATTDLVGLGVRHEHGALELRAQFRDLTTWRSRRMSFPVETAAGSFLVDVDTWPPAKEPEVSISEPGEPSPVDECGGYGFIAIGRPCDGLTLDRSTARDVVTVVVPRTCLGSPRWVRVGATVSRDVGMRTRYDAWGTPRQDQAGRYEDAMSPRIRHDR